MRFKRSTAKTAVNEKIINSLGDLPDVVGGFHILADGVRYVLGDNVTITNKIKMGSGTTLTGNGLFGSTLTYNGTGSMISGSDVDCVIEKINLSCPNAEVFNFIDSSTQISTVFINTVRVGTCDSWGTFQVLSYVQNNSNVRASTTSGVTFTGSGWVIVSIKEFFIETSTDGYKFIDFGTSVHQNIEVTNLVFLANGAGAPAIGISGLTSSGNILTGNIANVATCSFLGNITPLSGIDEFDIRWDFQGNTANVQDTVTKAAMNIPNSQTVTITTPSTAVIVNDTNTGGTNIWSLKTAKKFEFSSSLGRMTYKGERPVYLNIIVTATVEKAGGGSDEVCGMLVFNGTTQVDSKSCTDNHSPTSITVQTGLDFVKDDYIEFSVQNNDTAADVVIELSNLEIF